MICKIIQNINNSTRKSLFLLSMLMAVIFLISLFVGSKRIGFFYQNSLTMEDLTFLVISRIPRSITLILTGAGLSVCGVILQQLSQNRFISPTTAGTLDGAKLGILFSLLLFPNSSMLLKLLFAILFCFILTSLFTFFVVKILKYKSILVPILGVMYGYILNAICNIIGIELNIVQNMEGWMVGNFAKSIKGQYEVIYLILPLFIVCYLFAQRFTISSMGQGFSHSLGINYKSIMIIGLGITSITVSIIILSVGSIPFLDLVIPNIVSIIYGDNLKRNLPFIAIYGAISVIICDVVGRIIIFPYEVPSSIIIGSCGALIFLFILISKNK